MNASTKDIITLLQMMERGQMITALAYLSDTCIRDIMDHTENDDLRDRATIEWYIRRVRKLEETNQKYYVRLQEMEEKLLRKEAELNTLKGKIKNMEMEARMLAEPEFFMLTEEELICARDKGKIPAIKMYRARTDCGLKMSKDNVERAMELRGWAFKSYPPLERLQMSPLQDLTQEYP